MQFDNMREFLTIAETLNYSEAADRLYIAQSTLSHHIKNMETELGFPLFSYNNRKVNLTQFGLMMLPYAKKSVNLQDEYLKAVSDYKRNFQKPLYIAVPSSWHSWGLPDCLANYQVLHDNIQINLITCANQDIPQKILKKEYKLAFAIEGKIPESDGLKRITFGYEPPLIAIIPIQHPLAKKQHVTIEDLASEKLLLPSEDSYPYALALQMFHDANIEPKASINGITGQSAYLFVKRNLGIALIPDTDDQIENSNSWVKVPIEPVVGGNINLIYREDTVTEPEQSFIEFIHDYTKNP